MSPLSAQQQHIVRLALDKATCPDDLRWSAGGLLAQIALLSGNTSEELKHWDEVESEDGPLTLDRIRESGNGFAGWPLDALEMLDRVWRAGGDRKALESVLERFSGPTQTHGVDALTYEGPERRGAVGIWFDLKTVIAIIGFVALVMPVIIFLLRLSVDQRQNAADDARRDTENQAYHAAQQARIERVEASAAKFERAHSIYCSGVRRDSARLPDADC